MKKPKPKPETKAEDEPSRELVIRPVGRPSHYDPSYCELVVKYAKQGMSLVEIAVQMGCSRASFYDWAGQHPEFSAALTRARDISQAWWEEKGRLGIFGGDREIDSNLWYRNITNRFKADWAQTKEPQVDAGEMIDVKPVAIEADRLPPEKRELLTQLLLELKQIAEEEEDD